VISSTTSTAVQNLVEIRPWGLISGQIDEIEQFILPALQTCRPGYIFCLC